MKFYLIGIKGSGMCSLSNILFDLGNEVRGCDYKKEFFTDKKIKKEIIVDNIENFVVDKEYIYIIGNAFCNNYYKENLVNNNIQFYEYPIFIEFFFDMKKISISGTHGKTTTTSFISQLTNKEINVLCGDGYGRGCKEANYLILEACEYKSHFLNYTNKILVINNIELDHPDYYKSVNDVVSNFQKAALNSEIVVLNNDCNNARKIKHNNIITFGQNENSDVMFKYDKKLTIYFYGSVVEIEVDLSVYNIYNYVAGYIVCKLIGTEDDIILKHTKNLYLPSRRLETTKLNDAIIIDDYAHHPTEIKVTLQYLKKLYKKEIIVFFQPHTYSRTDKFLNEFVDSLSIADEVYILDVFSSVRENGSGNLLIEKTNFKKFDINILNEIRKSDKVYVFMGAGDVNKLIELT